MVVHDAGLCRPDGRTPPLVVGSGHPVPATVCRNLSSQRFKLPAFECVGYTNRMETTHQAPLTPEQLAAINAGGGFAHCEDPTTHVHYQLIQCEPRTIDDDYIRAKIEEAYADPAGFKPLDMAAIKAELQRRLAAGHKSGR